MNRKTAATLFMIINSVYNTGCIKLLDDVDNTKKKKDITYTGAEADLANCLVNTGIVFGYGDGGSRSEKQAEVFGHDAWSIMQDIYTECIIHHDGGVDEVATQCEAYENPDGSINDGIWPIWVFPNGDGGFFVTSGILTLDNFATFTSEYGCKYHPDDSSTMDLETNVKLATNSNGKPITIQYNGQKISSYKVDNRFHANDLNDNNLPFLPYSQVGLVKSPLKDNVLR